MYLTKGIVQADDEEVIVLLHSSVTEHSRGLKGTGQGRGGDYLGS